MAAATLNETGAPVQDSRLARNWTKWVGWALTIVPSLLLTMSGVMKVTQNPKAVEGLVGKLGFTASAVTGLGFLELLVVALVVIPRTAVLGAVLAAGYAGGILAIHVRFGEG